MYFEESHSCLDDKYKFYFQGNIVKYKKRQPLAYEENRVRVRVRVRVKEREREEKCLDTDFADNWFE